MMFGTQTKVRPVSAPSRPPLPFFQDVDNDEDFSGNEDENMGGTDLPMTSLLHERPMAGSLKMKTFFVNSDTEGGDKDEVDGVAKFRTESYVAVCGSDELVPPPVVTLRKPAGRAFVKRSVNGWKAAKRKAPPPPPPQRMSSLQYDDDDYDKAKGEADMQSAENSQPRPKPEIVQRLFVQSSNSHSNSETKDIGKVYDGCLRSADHLTNGSTQNNDSIDVTSHSAIPTFDVNLYMVKPSVHSISKQANNDTIAACGTKTLSLQKPKIPEKPKFIAKSNVTNAKTCPREKLEAIESVDNSRRRSLLKEIVPKLNSILHTADVTPEETPIPPPRKKHAKLKSKLSAQNFLRKTEMVCDNCAQPVNKAQVNSVVELSTSCMANGAPPHVECEKLRDADVTEQKHMALLTSVLRERHKKENTDDSSTLPNGRNVTSHSAFPSHNSACPRASRDVKEDYMLPECLSCPVGIPSNDDDAEALCAIGSIPPPPFDVASITPSDHSASSAHHLGRSRCDSVPQLIDELLQNGVKIRPPSEFDHSSERGSEAGYSLNIGAHLSGTVSHSDDDDSYLFTRPLHRSLPGPRSGGDLSVLVEDDYIPGENVKTMNRPTFKGFDHLRSSVAQPWRTEQNRFSDFDNISRTQLSESPCSSDSDVPEMWGRKPVALWDTGDVAEWCRANGFEQLQKVVKAGNIDGRKLLQLSDYDLIKLNVSSSTTREHLLEATRGLKCPAYVLSSSYWNVEQGTVGKVSSRQTAVPSLLLNESLTLPLGGSNISSRASSLTDVSGMPRLPSDTSVHSQVPLVKWSSSEVLDWLQSASLDEFHERFAEHHVTGKDLASINMHLLDKLHIDSLDERELILSRLYELQHPAGPSLEHLIEQQKLPSTGKHAQAHDRGWASQHRHRPLGRESSASDTERNSVAIIEDNERYHDRGASKCLSCSCTSTSNLHQFVIQYAHGMPSDRASGHYSHRTPSQNSVTSCNSVHSPCIVSHNEAFKSHTTEHGQQLSTADVYPKRPQTDGQKELLQEVALLKESIKERDRTIENMERLLADKPKENGHSLFAVLSGERASHVMCHELVATPAGAGFTVSQNKANHWIVKDVDSENGQLKPGDRLLELDGCAVYRLQNVEAVLQNLGVNFTTVVARYNDTIVEDNVDEDEEEEEADSVLRSDLSLALIEVDALEQENKELKLQLDRLKLSEIEARNENENVRCQVMDLRKQLDHLPPSLEKGRDGLDWLNTLLNADPVEAEKVLAYDEFDEILPLWESLKGSSKDEILQALKDQVMESREQKSCLDRLLATVISTAPDLLDNIISDNGDGNVDADVTEEFC